MKIPFKILEWTFFLASVAAFFIVIIPSHRLAEDDYAIFLLSFIGIVMGLICGLIAELAEPVRKIVQVDEAISMAPCWEAVPWQEKVGGPPLWIVRWSEISSTGEWAIAASYFEADNRQNRFDADQYARVLNEQNMHPEDIPSEWRTA